MEGPSPSKSENSKSDDKKIDKSNENVSKNDEKKKQKPGILRLDISKPRRSSGGSVEFRTHPELLGDVSPALSGPASPPQLSVTWAEQCNENEPNTGTIEQTTPNIRQMPTYVRSSLERGARGGSKTKRIDDKTAELSTDMTSPLSENNSEDEDYSVSVSAIIQKRASVRGQRKKGHRGGRRPSSPMDHLLLEPGISSSGGRLIDRRRSSVFTTSSGDTAISVEDGTNQDSSQEQIYENIRLHKEVIQSIKYQPWNIRRKLKLVRQAKTYIQRHEGVLQERFAMSRSTKDLWARFKIVIAARWLHFKRELASFSVIFIPWELRIKQIESHFGSGVASYFTFLRWLLWVNIMISIPLCAFVIVPEFVATDYSVQDDRKMMTPREAEIAGDILTIWEFEGYLKYSPLFYGYYTDRKDSGALKWGYNLPLAYFLTAVTVYIYSFVAILGKMAENSKALKLSSKDEECIFTWKVFTGWDYMIGHAETARNRMASVVVTLKEALLEEAEKKRDRRNWRIIVQRILINILIMGLLALSGYTVVFAVDRSETVGPKANWLRRNEVNVIMTLLSFFMPMIFEVLGVFEKWHPRKQLRFQLARVMILNLLNLYSLMFSFIYLISRKDENLQALKVLHENVVADKLRIEQMLERTRQLLTTTISTMFNENSFDTFINDITEDLLTTEAALLSTSSQSTFSQFPSLFSHMSSFSSPSIPVTEFSTTATQETQTQCFAIPVSCSKSSDPNIPTSKNNTSNGINLATSLVLLNLTTTLLPNNFSTVSVPLFMSSTSESMSTTTEYEENVVNDTYFEYYDYFDNVGGGGGDFIDPDELISKQRYPRDVRHSHSTQRDYEITIDDSEYSTGIITMNNDVRTTPKPLSTKPYENTIAGKSTEYQMPSSTTITDDSTDTTSFESNFTITITTPSESNFDETTIDYENQITTEYTQKNLTNFSIPTTTTTTSPQSTTTRMYFDKKRRIIFLTGGPYYEFNENGSCTKVICVPYTDELLAPTVPTTPLPRKPEEALVFYENSLNNVSQILKDIRKNLTSMCWETALGQELTKVIVLDLVIAIASCLIIDYFRALFVRYMNDHWCWDLEKTFPQYGDFKIAEGILNLVFNQGQVWMGIFFSPGIVIVNLVKLLIFMYLKSWIVLTCNVPHEVVFKASKSNNFYLALLLTMLFLCVLPVSFSIVWLKPSWHCGPFSQYNRVSEFFTTTIKEAFKGNEIWYKPLEYLSSASTVIPLMLLLILIIYYLVSLTGALREANQDLKIQLQKERMEERRKILKVPSEEKPADQGGAGITSRWKMVLEAASSTSPVTPSGPIAVSPEIDAAKSQARKDLLAKLMKKALRKSSVTSEDESILPKYTEDDTDTDHQDPLPHDEDYYRKDRSPKGTKRISKSRPARKPSIMDIVQLAKKVEGSNNIEQQSKGKFKIQRNVVYPDDNDPEANYKVVAERRRSLLKRQSKISEPSDSQPEPDDLDINYEVVNEKNNLMEKKSKREPRVFTFDEKSLDRKRSPDERQDKHIEKVPEKHYREKRQSDGYKRDKSPEKDVEKRPAKYSHKEEEEKHHERRLPDKQTEKTTETKVSPMSKKKTTTDIFYGKVQQKHEISESDEGGSEKKSPPSPAAEMMATISKGRKKIGSFLALVKEAVNTKKQEEGSIIEKSERPSTSDAHPSPAFQESSYPEDLSTEGEDEGDYRKESTMKIRRKAPPKRQDSQSSIWSDKLPTITISKTGGSEECILEGSEKDISKTDEKDSES